MNGEDGRRVRVRTSRPQHFSFTVEMSQNRWRLMLTEISCQMRSGMSRRIRLLRQLEETTASKRASLNSVQIVAMTSGLIFQPSLARPSPSGVYFCFHGSSHEEADLNFPVDNMDFRFVSAHLFEAFVEQSMGLCQGLPFRAHF